MFPTWAKYFWSLASCGFLVLFAIAVSWPVLVLRTNSFFVHFDNVQQFYPWYQKLSQALHNGYLPFWDANAFAGYFFLGEFQTGVFYPPNLLWTLIFGTRAGIDIYYLELLIVFHFFLASLGMYMLGREWGLSRFASLAAAIVFAYSGPVVYRAMAQTCIFFGLALLPLVIFLLARYIKTLHISFLFAAGAVVGLQILAGHLQPAIHTLLIGSFYLLWTAVQRQGGMVQRVLHFMMPLLALGAAAFVVSASQLIPALEYFRVAYRHIGGTGPLPAGDSVPYRIFAYTNLVEPTQFMNLLDPIKFFIPDTNEIYIGAFPLCLIAIFLARRTPIRSAGSFRDNWPWLFLLVVFAVLAVVGHYSPLSLILNRLPVLNSIRQPGRYVILLHFVLALSVGFAVFALQEFPLARERAPRWLAALIVGWIVLFICFIWSFDLWLALSATITYQVGLTLVFGLFAIVLRRHATALTALTLLLLGTGIVLNRNTYLPRTENPAYAAAAFARNQIIDYLAPYYGKYRVAEADPRDNVLPWNVGDVYRIQTKMGWGATVYKPFWDLVADDWSVDAKLNDALNVRFVVSKKPLDLKLLLQDPATGFFLYERKNYYPRVFFQNQIGWSGQSIEALNQFDLLEYSDHYRKYRIRARSAGQLIFSELYFPGWHVLMDGREAEMQVARIDGSAPVFVSVYLERGAHIVELRYNLDIFALARILPPREARVFDRSSAVSSGPLGYVPKNPPVSER